MRVEGESRACEGGVAISSVVVARSALVGSAAIVTLAAILASVPPVLDCIIAATMQTSCNLGPPLANLADENLYLGALLGCDGLMI